MSGEQKVPETILRGMPVAVSFGAKKLDEAEARDALDAATVCINSNNESLFLVNTSTPDAPTELQFQA
jgi:hypothetical protein